MNWNNLKSPADDVDQHMLEVARGNARIEKQDWLCWLNRDGTTTIGAVHKANMKRAERATWPERTIIIIDHRDGSFWFRGMINRGAFAITQAYRQKLGIYAED